jgi:hypothetical protein
MKRGVIWLGAAVVTAGLLSPAMARPGYLAAFKTHYNTASGKPMLNAANCALCHIGQPMQARWNVWGEALRTDLAGTRMANQQRIIQAFRAAESKMNPATRQTFAQMINADRMPGTTQGAPSTPPTAPRTGPLTVTWEPVFNGTDMSGWTKMNQGNWAVNNGILTYSGGGNGWLRTNKRYNNYSAVIVWRYTRPGNNDSGIFLKAASEGGNPWPSSPQLNMGPGTNLGNIGGTQGTRPRADLIKPVNEWNTYQVTVFNGSATLAINGQTAWPQATGLPTGPGYLGIQAEGAPVEIAGFWVAELP